MYLVKVHAFVDQSHQLVSTPDNPAIHVFRDKGDAVASFITSFAAHGPVAFNSVNGRVYLGDDVTLGYVTPVRPAEGMMRL